MADKKEKDFLTTEKAEFIRALSSDGQSRNIVPEVLLNQVNGLKETGFLISNDLNLIYKSGIYNTFATAVVESLLNKPSIGKSGEAAMLVLNSGNQGYVAQLYFNITSRLCFLRFCQGGIWYDWMSINLT